MKAIHYIVEAATETNHYKTLPEAMAEFEYRRLCLKEPVEVFVSIDGDVSSMAKHEPENEHMNVELK